MPPPSPCILQLGGLPPTPLSLLLDPSGLHPVHLHHWLSSVELLPWGQEDTEAGSSETCSRSKSRGRGGQA